MKNVTLLKNNFSLNRYAYIIFILFSMPVLGQLSSNYTVKLVPQYNDTTLVDSGFVLSHSLKVDGFSTGKDFDQLGNKIIWKVKDYYDTITVSYKKLDFTVSYNHKSKDIIRRSFDDNPFRYIPNNAESKDKYGTLKTVGNVSRGIGFGNAQDVVVNSNLNLRLSGKLANDVDVLAVISDENNPIQPEGNTQQIQDFDKVYITMKRDSAMVTLGDFLMKKPEGSYFINYYKKSRGVQFSNVNRKKNWRIATQAEAAISRGRFSRNKIDGLEGNSGPYRLTGENGELFIIIIAGTENVFLDGRQLTRGENNDYVINYNTGEVTFTPRILITRYSRIVVEFQYSDRNYGRSVSRLGLSVSKGKFTAYANGFNEMDLKSQQFQQNLEDSFGNKSAIDLLAEAGDGFAFLPKVRKQNEYNNNRIMYTKGVLAGVEIYIYAGDPSVVDTFYEVIFSNLGLGNGSYKQAQSAANGKVFEYVGEKQGEYDPIEVLIAPQRLNTMNVGIKIEKKGRKSGIEYSVSDFDKNTFSTINDEDNNGFGLRFYQMSDRALRDSSVWRWTSDINYEIVSDKYNYVERYRGVEFDRKWTKLLTNPTSLSKVVSSYEHIANVSFGISKLKETFFTNNASVYIRPGSFLGVSNLMKGGVLWNKIHLTSALELMKSQTNQGDTSSLDNDFYGLNIQVKRPVGSLILGGGYTSERSSFTMDTLLSKSYGFTSYNAFIQSGLESAVKYSLRATRRVDELPKNDGYGVSTIGNDINLQSSFSTKKRQRFELNTTYRQLEIKDKNLSGKPLENTLQSRVEMNLHFFKKFIKSRTFYELGTGQEQKREFQYLKVNVGQGVYIWNDYDTNDIKTLNEFEVASELDRQRADYIKIYTPVTGFITTNRNKISQTIELSPAVFYKKGLKKVFFARLNSLTTLILDKKVLPTTILDFINPIQGDLEDTALINTSKNFRSTVFFNRGNPNYSIDYTYFNNESKILLTNGFVSRYSQENFANVRINLGKKFTLNTKLSLGNRTYTSQFFSENNYSYGFYEVEPKLQILIKRQYRIELRSKYYDAQNSSIYGGEQSTNIEIGGSFKHTKIGKGALDVGASYIKVKYDGNASSTLGYELLRGLQNGDNATWKLGYQRTLSNNVQLVISYNGRQSEDAPVIHIGRLVARYLF